jgi:hypothetical protein
LTFEYRVFIDRGGDESIVTHFRDERLWEGATFRAHKPGTEVDGLIVVVYRLASHPTPDGPGIAYGRVADPR